MRRWMTACALVLASCGLVGEPNETEAPPAGEGSTTLTPLPTASVSVSGTPLPTPSSAAPEELAFAVIGDFGTGDDTQRAVADRMCAWHDDRPFELVITTGDNVYDVGSPDRFDEAFFEPYECLFDRGVRFRASLGNHDVQTDDGRPELEEPAFGMKGRNYVVRRSGVRFVIADSNLLDVEWLRAKTRAREGDRWTIVVFHHPVYSPGTHGSTPGFSPRLPRLFARRGVDLVLNGHDHLYAVSRPLRKIRYVVTGGGGAGLYECFERWFTAACEERHHFLWVVATDEEIKVKAVPPEGRPFHAFTTTGRP